MNLNRISERKFVRNDNSEETLFELFNSSSKVLYLSLTDASVTVKKFHFIFFCFINPYKFVSETFGNHHSVIASFVIYMNDSNLDFYLHLQESKMYKNNNRTSVRRRNL